MTHKQQLIYKKENTIPADAKQVGPIRARFIEFLLSLGIDDTEKEGWKLVFTEAVNNAIEHGSKNDPEKTVTICWWSTKTSVYIETQDQGKGPNVSKTEAPALPEDPLSESGRGLFIIDNFADKLTHWYSKEGYILRICKNYKHLNDVMPQNAEMDAILEELSDCLTNGKVIVEDHMLEPDCFEILIKLIEDAHQSTAGALDSIDTLNWLTSVMYSGAKGSALEFIIKFDRTLTRYVQQLSAIF